MKIKLKPRRLPLWLNQHGQTRFSILLQQLLIFFKDTGVKRRTLVYLELCQHLRQKTKEEGPRDYPVFVINRTKDIDRLKHYSRACARWGISFKRVDGVDCTSSDFDFSALDAHIGEMFYNQSRFLRGAFGCFLGHKRAWEAILASDCEFGLVCEDDARFLGPLPQRFADYGIPESAELVFANQRMAEGLLQNETVEACRKEGFIKVPVCAALRALLDIESLITGPGGDGYFLSRDGAAKLLRIFTQTKMHFDVDWFILFQCLDDETMNHYLKVDPTTRFHGYQPPLERLQAYVLSPSLVEQVDGPSKIRTGNYCSREELITSSCRVHHSIK